MEASCAEARPIMLLWKKAAHSKVGEAMLKEVAYDKARKTMLGMAGEVALFKIYVKIGTWWRE